MLNIKKWFGFGTKSAGGPVAYHVPPGSFMELAFSGGKLTDTKAFDLYRKNSTIATAVDMIAGAIEQIKPVIRFKDGTVVDDHEALTLLRQPNGFETYQEFIGKVARHYLVTHDCHIIGLGGLNRLPIEMYAAKPFNVSAEADPKDGYPKKYRVQNGQGSGTYNREETTAGSSVKFVDGLFKQIYHIMGFSSSTSDINGDSPLVAAALEAKQQIQGRVHNLSVLNNGGRLSLIFTFKDDLKINEDEQRLRSKLINEQFAGAEKAGKIASISGPDASIVEVGKSNKDMDFAQLDKIAGQAIYMRYNIPLPLVSTDASTYNNIENSIVYLYQHTVLPTFTTLFSGISKFLLPRMGIDPAETEITYDETTIRPLMTRLLTELKLRKEINIETINELRSFIPNREDVDGGDVIYQTAANVPLGSDVFEDATTSPEDKAKAYMLERDNNN